MDQDHELDEVRARLLPERLLAATKEIGHERGDAVGQRVGVEIVVERVVSIPRGETDLDVIVGTPVTREDVADGPAEVALYFQDETADPAGRVMRLVGEQLFDVGVHAGGGLPRPDGADDEHPRVEPALGNDEPAWLARALRRASAVLLAEHEKEFITVLGRGIRRERLLGSTTIRLDHEDVEPRAHAADREERRAEPERGVCVAQLGVQRRALGLNQRQQKIVRGERPDVESDRAHHDAQCEAEDEPVRHHGLHGGVHACVSLRDRDPFRAAGAVGSVGETAGCAARHARKSRSFSSVRSIS